MGHVDVDEIMKWMEWREDGDTIREIAEKGDRSTKTVTRYLKLAQKLFDQHEEEVRGDIQDELKEEIGGKVKELKKKLQKEKERSRVQVEKTGPNEISFQVEGLSETTLTKLFSLSLRYGYQNINRFVERRIIPLMKEVTDFEERFGKRLTPQLLQAFIGVSLERYGPQQLRQQLSQQPKVPTNQMEQGGP